jgi:uncharacterized membrane protein YeiH
VTAQFQLPFGFDLGAVFLFALTGAWVAIRRKYDVVGVFTLALVTGVGGSLLRDAVFIQQGHPAAMQDQRYVWAVAAASVLGALSFPLAKRFKQLVASVDALALGVYAVVGAQKALATGLSPTDAILVGVINATGGLIRDVLVRDEPSSSSRVNTTLAAFAGTSLFTLVLIYWHASADGGLAVDRRDVPLSHAGDSIQLAHVAGATVGRAELAPGARLKLNMVSSLEGRERWALTALVLLR